MAQMKKQKAGRSLCKVRTLLLAALALSTLACAAASRPPDPTGPTTAAPNYPVVLIDVEAVRKQAALLAWAGLAREQGIVNPPEPELQPVTATIRALPPLQQPLYLPKVGAGATMNEEETRESLRRFIDDARELLGIELQQLSLVLRTDLADGTKRAHYEQRPFRYPFRNGYGVVEITFAPDRRILQLTSTAIPDAERLRERLRAAGAARTLRPETATPEMVAKLLPGKTFTYTGAGGTQSTYTLTGNEGITVRELVIHPVLKESTPPALELHLAWEITLASAPVSTIYLDAVTTEVLAAR